MSEGNSIFRSPYDALPTEKNSLLLNAITADCDVRGCEFTTTGELYKEINSIYLLWGGILEICRDHHSALRDEEEGDHNSFTLLKGQENIGHVAVSVSTFAGMVWIAEK